MRFADRVKFVQIVKGHYDTDAGEWTEDGTKSVERLAHVTTPSRALASYSVSTSSRLSALPGDAQVNQIIVHLKTPMLESYDHMEWQGDSYYFASQSTKGPRQIILMRGDHDGTDA